MKQFVYLFGGPVIKSIKTTYIIEHLQQVLATLNREVWQSTMCYGLKMTINDEQRTHISFLELSHSIRKRYVYSIHFMHYH